MDERTVSYARVRFADYYKHIGGVEVPDTRHREFAVIPWQADADPPMFRHKSALDYDDAVQGLLTDEAPRHAYCSAARYRAPSTNKMSEKGWLGTDLIFDLDGDHLPGVNEQTPYKEQLARCKEELYDLIDIIETELGHDDYTIVFSGGRGYHVHVRTEEVQQLDSKSRRDIVDYIRGNDVSIADITMKRKINKRQGRTRTLQYEGGWGMRIHKELVNYADKMSELPEEEALAVLKKYDNIGTKKAEKILATLTNRTDAIEEGTVTVEREFKEFLGKFIGDVVADSSSAIDEPVTTDTRRLIRIPNSLHGGTGLRVVEIDRDDLDEFSPLEDAVPSIFKNGSIDIRLLESAEVDIGECERTFDKGEELSVPEYVGIHLMCKGLAEKS